MKSFIFLFILLLSACANKKNYYRITGRVEDRYQDRAELRRIIRDHIQDLRDCYLDEDDRNSLIPKQIEVEMKIFPDGVVRYVDIKNVSNHRLEKCLVRAIMNIKYPEPEEHAVLNVIQQITLIEDYPKKKLD